jgi:hypothetical protein
LRVLLAKIVTVLAIAFRPSTYDSCYGSGERLRNITCRFFKFLVVKTDPLSSVSYKVAVCMNVFPAFAFMWDRLWFVILLGACVFLDADDNTYY